MKFFKAPTFIPDTSSWVSGLSPRRRLNQRMGQKGVCQISCVNGR